MGLFDWLGVVWHCGGMNVHARAGEDTSPLLRAIDVGDKKLVRVLLDWGADPNDTSCTYPLYAALSKKDADIVRVLAERGASLDLAFTKGIQKDAPEFGLNALGLAIFHEKYELAQFLLAKGASAECENNRGLTPLMMACKSGPLNVIESIIKTGVCINSRTKAKKAKHRRSALMFAMAEQRMDVIGLLVKNGADTDIGCVDGESILTLVLQKSKAELALLLIEQEADFSLSNEDGLFPISLASSKGQRSNQCGRGPN